jgi:biopolymer transport protein TolR
VAFGIHQFSRRRRSKRAPMAEINVTPLVDVMLVLLVVFMVTAPLLKAGVPVDLPDSRAKALAEESRQVTIAMTRSGEVFLDDVPLAQGELAARLAALPQGEDGKSQPVTLRADKALDYGRVIAVMGELNRAGFTAITLVTGAATTEPSLTSGSGAEQ